MATTSRGVHGLPTAAAGPETHSQRCDRHARGLADLLDRPDWSRVLVPNVAAFVAVHGVSIPLTMPLSLERRVDESWALRIEHDLDAVVPAGSEQVLAHLRVLGPPFRRYAV